ncbi:MAG TPA: DMT family transporter [Solirubrobacteraceae bacterium]|nr:DMT family transporter [Solirubrobacteraceae bacterium]
MTRRAWILMLSLAALWGASYMFIEIALDDGLSSTFLVFARTALGALVLAPVALSRGAFAPARRHVPMLVLIAAIQVTGPFLLITAGQHHVTSSMAGILVASAPIFTTAIAAFLVHDDRLGPTGIAGIFVGIVGVAMLFGVDLTGTTETLLAGLGILLASLGYAVGATLSKRHLHDVPPVGVAASIIGIGALLLLPLAPFTAPSSMPGAGTWAALFVLGAGGTGIAFLIFYVLNADVGPSRASVVAYIAPFFSVVYGVTLLDEPFTAGTAGGLVLILVGSWLAADGRVPWRAISRTGPSRSSVPAPARAQRSPAA